MDFPGHDLAAIDIHDQVQIPVLTTHRGRIITDVPTPTWFGPVAVKLLGSGTLRGGFMRPLWLLLELFQCPIKRRLRGQIKAFVSE
ncbi:hypothetical protein BKP64_05660 [Marinobacter salinus]|uniref:Uncharacterized protein n=1 Tax=Marinobacter salinus TaxID=1874317 RepID=A0A1D9GJ81_9GAMM|nr:hypothetical protein BKP64_05660 [Marinobacter salinus]